METVLYTFMPSKNALYTVIVKKKFERSAITEFSIDYNLKSENSSR